MALARSVPRRANPLKLQKSENDTLTLCAGDVRPGAVYFAWRVRELCTRHVDTQLFAAQKHGIHDVREDVAGAPAPE